MAETANRSALKSAVAKAGIFSFVFVMYSYTTGGPFGLEEQVTTSGPGMTLLFDLLIPLFWCIPISFVVAELTTAMPVQGGFYRWVRAGYGDFWGFLAGWWNWSASFLLGGAYAVLFTDYLAAYFPALHGWRHYAVCLAFIALIIYINVRGIKLVGEVSGAMEIFVLLPVLVMIVIGLTHWHHNPFVPLTPPRKPFIQVFGVGLALGIWLYSGYEQMSTVAEEVENPKRNYPLALAIVVPLSIATYFLPTFASLATLNNWRDWNSGYFSTAAKLIGGPWLGVWMTLAAMITNASLLNATVLATTRMPFAMAEDGLLPRGLTRLHPRYGTPAVAIIVSGVIYAILAIHTLTELIAVYAWLRVATTILTALSGWRLRKTHPGLPRSFLIPGGRGGLAYSVAAPIAMATIAILGSIASGDRFVLILGPAALLLGPIVYIFAKRRVQEA
ncbi:MAG TPA: APC family permease [Terriglobales bacterium]|nr:APC family permease [Terriglobales bacterium]